jgi:hypothetical protein
MARLPFPDANAPLADLRTGAPTPPWYRVFDLLFRRFSAAESDIAALPSAQQTEFGSWLIPFAENKSYRLIVSIPYGITINSVTTVCASGTCTATVKINTTALGGSANSVSTTEQTQSHTSSNVMAAGDDLVLTISANANCEDVTITISGTRTLAT